MYVNFFNILTNAKMKFYKNMISTSSSIGISEITPEDIMK